MQAATYFNCPQMMEEIVGWLQSALMDVIRDGDGSAAGNMSRTWYLTQVWCCAAKATHQPDMNLLSALTQFCCRASLADKMPDSKESCVGFCIHPPSYITHWRVSLPFRPAHHLEHRMHRLYRTSQASQVLEEALMHRHIAECRAINNRSCNLQLVHFEHVTNSKVRTN